MLYNLKCHVQSYIWNLNAYYCTPKRTPNSNCTTPSSIRASISKSLLLTTVVFKLTWMGFLPRYIMNDNYIFHVIPFKTNVTTS